MWLKSGRIRFREFHERHGAVQLRFGEGGEEVEYVLQRESSAGKDQHASATDRQVSYANIQCVTLNRLDVPLICPEARWHSLTSSSG